MKILLILISLLLSSFLCSLSFSPSENQCLDDQRFALLQLINDNLFYAPNFTFFNSKPTHHLWDLNTTDCCSWNGISCDAFGHVIGLDLSSNNLSGSFQPIFNLHHLQRLNLAGNNFNTTLFQYEFERLPNLTHLNLSNSWFHGQIPLDISNLTRLVSLDLSYQDSCYRRYHQILDPYYYPLPSELQQPLKLENPNLKTLIKKLASLTELYLDSVDISTQSDRWCQTTSILLPNLRVLSLSSCGLKGPLCSSLSKLPVLSKLFLDGNPITYLPPNFLEISSRLVSLSLKSCNLSGHFPTEILSFPKMQSIDISDNENLGGQLPEFPLGNAVRSLTIADTNFSGKLPESIGNLKFLTNLNLHFCHFSGKLPESTGNLKFLTNLNLYGCNFGGIIPSSIANLSNLVELDLSGNNFSGHFPTEILSFPKMQSIDISYNDYLGGQLPEFPLGNALRSLTISYTNFSGKLPESIGNLKFLKTLNLQYCHFSGIIPSSIVNLSNLVELGLSGNNFSGSIPPFHRSGVPNLSGLSLEGNRLSGSIPSSLFTLPSLQTLFLRYNQLDGEIGEIPNASSSLIESLYIGYNNFDSHKLDKFFQLKNLRFLDLSNMSLLIGTHNKTLTEFPQLEWLTLRSCNLTEFPEFIKTQDRLFFLDLSNNQIHGLVPNWLWKKTTLSEVDLSFNSNIDFPKEFPSDDADSSFPKLTELQLRSCNISTFPAFLKNVHIVDLDLSNNKISGAVPNWVLKKSLVYLDLSNNSLSSLVDQSQTSSQGSLSTPTCNSILLQRFNASHNKLNGPIPSCLGNISTLSILDLQNNNFNGSLPDFAEASQLVALQLNDNQLEGKLPSSFANCTQLEVLNVGNNSLHDTFPSWLGKLPTLTVLVLRANRFYGPIKHVKNNFAALDVLDFASNNFSGQLPTEFFEAPQLIRSVKMGGNKFQGKLPKSLANCTSLEVLDFGKNRLHDTFPFWLEKLPHLKVLVLRGNGFYGAVQISEVRNAFPMLRILDLASNEFSGELCGEFFRCLKAMMVMGDEKKAKPKYIGEDNFYYQDSVTVVNKGLEMVLEKILTTYTCLDLSNNRFHGIIPEEIRNLTPLIVLNLSRNGFYGQIPLALGDLKELESLDLSKNHLSGEIPPQLTTLTFLSALNLSYNQLQGSIPQSNQFGTFSNESYKGNRALCGLPLTKRCNEDEADVPIAAPGEDADSGVDNISVWKIVLMGYGSGLVIGLSIGFTVLNEMGNKWLHTYKTNRKRNGIRSR